MGAFEHVMAMLSFIYALAISHVLTMTASLIRAGSRVRFSWLYAFWAANALVICVANWLSFWDLRTAGSWPVSTILFFLGMAIINYLQSALVVFETTERRDVDLAAFHNVQGRRYAGAFLAGAVYAFAANLIYGGNLHIAEWTAQNLVVIPMIAFGGVAVIWRGPIVQALAAIGIGLCWIVYFAELQAALH